jgi:hypothetical protein
MGNFRADCKDLLRRQPIGKPSATGSRDTLAGEMPEPEASGGENRMETAVTPGQKVAS